MSEKLKDVLNNILEKFKTGKIPEAVAMASFPIDDTPSSRWSFINRMLMFIHGTTDARGFRQWKQANRWVKKNAKAFHILVPCFREVIDLETGEEDKEVSGFKPCPVFAVEDTDGELLESEKLELPELPLLKKAEQWGISVKAIPGNFEYKGYFLPTKKEIGLASPEENIFFHELSHAAHEKIKGKLKLKQDPFQEIVAELSAQALCRIVGKRADDTLGNSYKYIESYAEDLDMKPHIACLKVLSETEKVLKLILGDL